MNCNAILLCFLFIIIGLFLITLSNRSTKGGEILPSNLEPKLKGPFRSRSNWYQYLKNLDQTPVDSPARVKMENNRDKVYAAAEKHEFPPAKILYICETDNVHTSSSSSDTMKKLWKSGKVDTLDTYNAYIQTSIISVFRDDTYTYILEQIKAPKHQYEKIYIAFCLANHILEIPCTIMYGANSQTYYQEFIEKDVQIFAQKYGIDPSQFTSYQNGEDIVYCIGTREIMINNPSPLRFEFLANIEYLAKIGAQIIINLSIFSFNEGLLEEYINRLGGIDNLLLPFWKRYFSVVKIHWNVYIEGQESSGNLIELRKIANLI